MSKSFFLVTFSLFALAAGAVIAQNNSTDQIADATLNATVAGSNITYYGLSGANNTGNTITGGSFTGNNGLNAAVQSSGVASSTQVSQTATTGNITIGSSTPPVPR